MTTDNAIAKGYCGAPAKVMPALATSAERVAYIKPHLIGCQRCRFANLMLNAEHLAAERIGPAAVKRFERGEVQRFTPERVAEAIRYCLRFVPAEERPSFLAWMAEVARRWTTQ